MYCLILGLYSEVRGGACGIVKFIILHILLCLTDVVTLPHIRLVPSSISISLLYHQLGSGRSESIAVALSLSSSYSVLLQMLLVNCHYFRTIHHWRLCWCLRIIYVNGTMEQWNLCLHLLFP